MRYFDGTPIIPRSLAFVTCSAGVPTESIHARNRANVTVWDTSG